MWLQHKKPICPISMCIWRHGKYIIQSIHPCLRIRFCRVRGPENKVLEFLCAGLPLEHAENCPEIPGGVRLGFSDAVRDDVGHFTCTTVSTGYDAGTIAGFGLSAAAPH